MYLGVDAWQLPNGFDILGAVIYQSVEDNSLDPKLEAMPLDFIRLAESHTGEYLARVITFVMEKFGIHDKVSFLLMVSYDTPLTELQVFRSAGLSATMRQTTK